MGKYSERTPCASCPYRREVKLAYWAVEEYQNLLDQDADPLMGGMFACHQDRVGKVEPKDRRPCVGWLNDQAKRRVPSLQLRMRMMRDDDAAQQVLEVEDSCKDLDLYDSIQEMAHANYPDVFEAPDE